MVFLITVETSDLARVTPLLFLLLGLGVVTSCRGLFVLFPPTVLELLLLILPVFFLSRLHRIVMCMLTMTYVDYYGNEQAPAYDLVVSAHTEVYIYPHSSIS